MSYGQDKVGYGSSGTVCAQQFAPLAVPSAQQSEIAYFIEQLTTKTTMLENCMTALNDKLRPATRQEPCANKVEQPTTRPTCTEIGSTLSMLTARLGELVARMETQQYALEI